MITVIFEVQFSEDAIEKAISNFEVCPVDITKDLDNVRKLIVEGLKDIQKKLVLESTGLGVSDILKMVDGGGIQN